MSSLDALPWPAAILPQRYCSLKHYSCVHQCPSSVQPLLTTVTLRVNIHALAASTTAISLNMPQLPGGQAERNLLRMRQADRAGVSPDRFSGGMSLIHPTANRLSYDSLSKNDLTFNLAADAFEEASFFEALCDPDYKNAS